jgi:hypothetical protein
MLRRASVPITERPTHEKLLSVKEQLGMRTLVVVLIVPGPKRVHGNVSSMKMRNTKDGMLLNGRGNDGVEGWIPASRV